MTPDEVVQFARACFLGEDCPFGCAETVLVALRRGFGQVPAPDPSPALALNGGVAWQGHICGSLSGAAIAVALLASRQMPYPEAKVKARQLVAHLALEFQAQFGSVNCRDLIGRSIQTEEEHAAFLESGIWRDRCMRQIEFVIRTIHPAVESMLNAAPALNSNSIPYMQPGHGR